MPWSLVARRSTDARRRTCRSRGHRKPVGPVPGERRARILGMLVESWAGGSRAKKLCRVCADVTSMTGAGIMLMSGDIPRGSACTTDHVSSLIEELQYELGEGPCVDAYESDRPVVEPDLVSPDEPRWLAFSEPVVAAGARAVFGFPL